MSTEREQAMAWWNLMAESGRKINMETARLFVERTPSTLTGSEIEQVWNKRGKPFPSMKFGELSGDELYGRVVKIVGRDSVKYSTIVEITPKYFRTMATQSLFAIETGNMRGNDDWSHVHAELVTLEEALTFIEEEKRKRAMQRLKDDIVRQVGRNGVLAPTMEQLEAAAKALGMVKM